MLTVGGSMTRAFVLGLITPATLAVLSYGCSQSHIDFLPEALDSGTVDDGSHDDGKSGTSGTRSVGAGRDGRDDGVAGSRPPPRAGTFSDLPTGPAGRGGGFAGTGDIPAECPAAVEEASSGWVSSACV